eukprot:TRINITY_DN48612_c0_g1_i1.p1 TRINITY_DN48612_c0_g1~~TRINITY_DN48612_c0_g1_i1.p1  ORF type:complete len:292 (+),score=47.02 TRINITY_DN48612_c0_g1_i1:48-923(+)
MALLLRRILSASGRYRGFSSSAFAVSPCDVASYHADGAVVLRNVLTQDEVAALRECIDLNLKHPGPLAGIASATSDTGRFFEDFCNWQQPWANGYRRIAFESALPAVAAALMDSRTVRLHHDHLLVKEPATQQRTPWHQDQPYYNITGNQNVSFWIPVDAVPRESTLEFVRASHAGGRWYLPKTFLSEEALWFSEKELAELPEVADSDVIGWALEPGDAVAFHMLTVHGSAGSRDLRRTFSLRVIGDDVRHAPRPWRTSPEFEGLAQELADGAKMSHALFPVVYGYEGDRT